MSNIVANSDSAAANSPASLVIPRVYSPLLRRARGPVLRDPHVAYVAIPG